MKKSMKNINKSCKTKEKHVIKSFDEQAHCFNPHWNIIMKTNAIT